jgi:hypothetical protein
VVAVWDLEDVGPLTKASPVLGELLSSEILDTIRQKDTYTVVERERLRLVLEELKLGTTSLVDESTRLRLGKLVGATLMVFGGYQAIGDTVRLDVRLVEVESGRTIKAVFKTAPVAHVSELLKAARAATADLM